MSIAGWRVHFTRRELALPREVTPLVREFKAAIDTVLAEAAARGRRPTVTAVERFLDIPHATFHRRYADLIDARFRPRIPAPARPAIPREPSGPTYVRKPT
ncbi:hypothetical protein [Streptomyces sp. NPDC097610]|uniref:hypothetical protein n=1 Tax=Streptomyces sp. NPDC097610 TaxID=3157227 RepID=UPI00331FA169